MSDSSAKYLYTRPHIKSIQTMSNDLVGFKISRRHYYQLMNKI